ncbi:alpha/beta hydrolase [Candidatus Amesbacteria bacterium]|nr:alpha/beta hydrolase [Candidatus Amesbacteria bacterium]
MKQEAILVHGWDPRFYNNQIKEPISTGMAWSHRPELIKRLREKYNICCYNLPGFCGIKEPNKDKFSVEDFVQDFFEWKEKKHKDAKLMIGYSFGGAILLSYKAKYHDSTPTILISPAIFRSESNRSELAKRLKPFIPSYFADYFRHVYQYFVSEYYRRGSPFLRSTYNSIARADLRPLLSKVDVNKLLLIYGKNDEATPWNLVKDTIRDHKINCHLVSDGGHRIGQTHPGEIIKAINEFCE